MCGIVGILGKGPVAPQIVDALKRLEYRGYDSAGIATLEHGHLERRRAGGKLVNLEARLMEQPLSGTAGIGHTRWATHGAPTESNAHPHATERVAIVHNGIIENFQALKREILAAGRTLASDTDTEVVAHLITMGLDRGLKPVEAMAETLKRLEGAFALAVLFAGEDDLLVAARRGSPLALGHGDGEMFLGSDAIALAPFTQATVGDEEAARHGQERVLEAGRHLELGVRRVLHGPLADVGDDGGVVTAVDAVDAVDAGAADIGRDEGDEGIRRLADKGDVHDAAERDHLLGQPVGERRRRARAWVDPRDAPGHGFGHVQRAVGPDGPADRALQPGHQEPGRTGVVCRCRAGWRSGDGRPGERHGGHRQGQLPHEMH